MSHSSTAVAILFIKTERRMKQMFMRRSGLLTGCLFPQSFRAVANPELTETLFQNRR